MMIDNEINIFDWGDRLSADGVMNVGYDDDVILMDTLFDLMKIDW